MAGFRHFVNLHPRGSEPPAAKPSEKIRNVRHDCGTAGLSLRDGTWAVWSPGRHRRDDRDTDFRELVEGWTNGAMPEPFLEGNSGSHLARARPFPLTAMDKRRILAKIASPHPFRRNGPRIPS
jgi:hypothetical protein